MPGSQNEQKIRTDNSLNYRALEMG